MDKQAVEANELRFQQKVEKLRSHLAGRQQAYQRKRKAGLGITVLAPLLLVVAAVGYYVTGNTAFQGRPSTPVASEKQDSSGALPAPVRETSVTVSRANTPQPPAVKFPEEEEAPPVKATSVAVEVGKAPASAETPTLDRTTPDWYPRSAVALLPGEATRNLRATLMRSDLEVEPVETQLPADVPAPRTPSLHMPKTHVVAAVEPESASPAAPPLAHMRVARSLACLRVEERQCVGAQDVFALSQHSNPHVWMEVHSQSLPYVLKHVYYHQGEKYAEVPLDITYPRMRTWSNVTLQSPTHVGSWRVEVVTADGTVLDQVRFRVTP